VNIFHIHHLVMSKRLLRREEQEPLLPITGSSQSTAPSPNQVHKKEIQRLPKRTTKTSQKLTLFPEALQETILDDSMIEGEDQLPHVSAKAQKERLLSKLERKYLPRVTAYCTANSYKMDDLMESLRKKNHIHRAAPRRFDEVIYTPFTFTAITELAAQQASIPDRISVSSNHDHEEPGQSTDNFFDQSIDASGKSIPQNISYGDLAKRIAPFGEVLYFDYGVIVMWGFNADEEKLILQDLLEFEEERLNEESVETEQFYFHYNCKVH
jgi:uncharacterized Rmd1/YagE family protein